MAVATGTEHGLDADGVATERAPREPRGRELPIATLDLHPETEGASVSTSPKPFNPFGL